MESQTESHVDRADRLSRRRARMLPALGIFFLTQQFAFFSRPVTDRMVDHVRLGAWVVMTAALLLALTTGGGWLRGREVRELMNDEVTRAHRAAALSFGFVAAIVAAMLLYVFEPALRFDVFEVIHLIVSAGMVAALVRFGMLERRAHS